MAEHDHFHILFYCFLKRPQFIFFQPPEAAINNRQLDMGVHLCITMSWEMLAAGCYVLVIPDHLAAKKAVSGSSPGTLTDMIALRVVISSTGKYRIDASHIGPF
jgi:hypothetical protein